MATPLELADALTQAAKAPCNSTFQEEASKRWLRRAICIYEGCIAALEEQLGPRDSEEKKADVASAIQVEDAEARVKQAARFKEREELSLLNDKLGAVKVLLAEALVEDDRRAKLADFNTFLKTGKQPPEQSGEGSIAGLRGRYGGSYHVGSRPPPPKFFESELTDSGKEVPTATEREKETEELADSLKNQQSSHTRQATLQDAGEGDGVGERRTGGEGGEREKERDKPLTAMSPRGDGERPSFPSETSEELEQIEAIMERPIAQLYSEAYNHSLRAMEECTFRERADVAYTLSIGAKGLVSWALWEIDIHKRERDSESKAFEARSEAQLQPAAQPAQPVPKPKQQKQQKQPKAENEPKPQLSKKEQEDKEKEKELQKERAAAEAEAAKVAPPLAPDTEGPVPEQAFSPRSASENLKDLLDREGEIVDLFDKAFKCFFNALHVLYSPAPLPPLNFNIRRRAPLEMPTSAPPLPLNPSSLPSLPLPSGTPAPAPMPSAFPSTPGGRPALNLSPPFLPTSISPSPNLFGSVGIVCQYYPVFIDWAKALLARAKWEHDLLGYNDAYSEYLSGAYMELIQNELVHIYDIYKHVADLCFNLVQKLSVKSGPSPTADAMPNLEGLDICIRDALLWWGEAIDGMHSIKSQFCAVDASEPEAEQLQSLTDVFLTVYSTRIMYRGDVPLQPLIALALCKHEVTKVAALQVIQHLALHTDGELKEEATKRVALINEVRTAEVDHFKEAVMKEMQQLPREVKREVNKSNLKIGDIVKNFDVFRNCLLFETRYSIRHPTRSAPASSFASFESLLRKRLQARQLRELRYQQREKKLDRSQQTAADLMIRNRNAKAEFTDIAQIGHGAFGEVFTGKRVSDRKEVAIKVMRCNPKRRDHQWESIKKEITVLSSCNHPNIVNYLSSYLCDTSVWVVMEYCDGGTLRNFCNKTSPKEAELAYLCREILQGLDYLHEKGDIHKDIKGDNILLHLTGEVKIADLGLCGGARTQSLHSIAGSRSFMAPEMIKRHGYNTKLDIWSFGCLIMEMVEGEPPYRWSHPLKTLFTIATEGAPPLKRPDKWSTTFRTFLGSCLQLDPSLRPTAKQLLGHPFITKAVEKQSIAKLFCIVFLDEALSQSGLL